MTLFKHQSINRESRYASAHELHYHSNCLRDVHRTCKDVIQRHPKRHPASSKTSSVIQDVIQSHPNRHPASPKTSSNVIQRHPASSSVIQRHSPPFKMSSNAIRQPKRHPKSVINIIADFLIFNSFAIQRLKSNHPKMSYKCDGYSKYYVTRQSRWRHQQSCQ